MARACTSRRRGLTGAAMGWCLLSGVACGRLLGVTDLSAAADASDASAGDDTATPADTGDGSSSNDDASSDAPACTEDLSSVLNDDFTISFTFQTSQLDTVVALLNQRLVCTSGVFWEARL